MADDGRERQRLASWMAGLGVTGITIISVTVIFLSTAHDEASKYVMAAVVPLFASWVATVLAYYFARENLRSATDSVASLISTNAAQLDGVSAKSKMIERTRIVTLSDQFKSALVTTTLKDIMDFLDQRGVGRSPIFNPSGAVVQMLHTSAINDFIRKQVDPAKPAAPGAKPVDQLTFTDLIADPQIKRLLESSFDVIAEVATLADAKAKMNATPDCEDVFVTKTGARGEVVLGWITDNIVLEASK